MNSLAQRIIERFTEGTTLERDDLVMGSGYDSVGRALRQLVDEGKIVRVGRGRYRKAHPSARRKAAGSIGEAVERRIRQSKRNVFLRRDFESLGSYDAVGRALRQKTVEGKLVQIGYGLYAKAERSPFTGKPSPVVGISKLATEALGRLGKKVAPSILDAEYNERRSTQVPTGRAIGIQGRVKRRIGYDGKYVVLQRTR